MLRNKVPFSRIIHVGLDRDVLSTKRNKDYAIRHELGIDDNEIVLLFVGRLIDYKKPILACEILQEMLNRGINAKLFIIGKGALEEELAKYINKNDLTSKVIWLKSVPYKNMYRYMVACDICINLSSKEIFGMTVLEALYYGVPVVASHAPGPDVIIEDGISGYLCDYGDNAAKWANKISLAIQNRDYLSKNAHIRIEKNFMWERVADEFLKNK